MKKLLIYVAAIFVLVIVLLLARATWYFSDSQFQPQQSLTTVDLNENAVLERFSESIKFPTISHDDRSQFDADAFSSFNAFLETSFPLVHSRMTRQTVSGYSLLYHLPGTDSSLKPALFMGHIDVVPVDESTRADWQQPPFSGAIADGAVWGRGTMDDKVTVIALMEAMELLLADGYAPKRGIYFAFGHDEEVGGNDGAKQVANLLEQQGITFEFILDEGGAVTEGLLLDTAYPTAIIGIAEKGYVNVKLSARAEGGHSSQPPVHTAAGILSQAIVNLEHNQFPADVTYIFETISHVGFHAPFVQRLLMGNLWLFEPLIELSANTNPATAASMRTTIATTMLKGSSKSNILPTEASAVVNLRLMPGHSIQDAVAHIREVIDDERISVTTFEGTQASDVSRTDSLGYRLIEQTIRRLDENILVAPYLVQGGTDAKHFSELSDSIYRFMMVRLNKTRMKQFHGVNEHMPIDDYLQAIQFYHALLKQTMEGEQPQ